MSRIKLRNTSRLRLTDMLRKRKLTLRQFVDELGITTYESLTMRCNRMGISAPSIDEFNALGIVVVTSPTEGVVVLEPPPVIIEQTGKPVEEPAHVSPIRNGLVDLVASSEAPQVAHKKSKKRKDEFHPRNSHKIMDDVSDRQETSQEPDVEDK